MLPMMQQKGKIVNPSKTTHIIFRKTNHVSGLVRLLPREEEFEVILEDAEILCFPWVPVDLLVKLLNIAVDSLWRCRKQALMKLHYSKGVRLYIRLGQCQK